jgi:site-specific DNA recombinase
LPPASRASAVRPLGSQGRQVWNRQRTDSDLVDPANTGLGHRPVQRWNLPAGSIISAHPVHPAIVTETDFIPGKDLAAQWGPDSPAGCSYLLAGLVRCAIRGRLPESYRSNGKPAYRCRHGRTTPTRLDTARPGNAYIREDQILPRFLLLGSCSAPKPQSTGQLGVFSACPCGRCPLNWENGSC